MSTIVTSNVSDGTLSIPTTYVTNGSAKAWVNFNGTGTIAARDSFNVASLTDHGTGDYTVNYSNNMDNGNYAVNTSANNTTIFYALMSSIDTGAGLVLVGSARFYTASDSSGADDARTVNFSLYGDLA